VALEYRYAENQYDRLPALAADLVRRRVAVIVAAGAPLALAAKAAPTTIPIVFASGADPVALGLVASLNRPGANVTGSVGLITELGPKQLQLLRELIPDAPCSAFSRTRPQRLPNSSFQTCRRLRVSWAFNSLL
jgi:putative ABC transport system substrate-binding protein